VRAIRDLGVYVIQHGVRTNNIYLSKPQKAALEKTAKEKVFLLLKLVRRIIDKELHADKNKKGEPLIAAAGAAAKNTTPAGRRRRPELDLFEAGPFIRQLRAYRHRGMTCTAGLWHLGASFLRREIFRGSGAKENMKVWQAARCALPTPRESERPQDNVKREPASKASAPNFTPEHKRSTDNRHQTKEAHPTTSEVKRM